MSARWRRAATAAVISASAPRGGMIVYFSAETGRYLGSTAIADSSGIAGFGAKSFLASNGEGRIIEAEADRPAREIVSAPGIAFDNHLRVVL